MNLPFQIKTIDEFNESTLVEKKSTFIARIYSADSEDKAKEHLSDVKKKYYDASHHCYAYKFTDGNFRYSDAGEPSGSAGVRILNAIEHFNLVNIIVIVTRYFGGVKLGIGPLGKAYYIAAYQVLNQSSIISKQLFQKTIIKTDFENSGTVQRILAKQNSIILESNYEEEVKLICLINAKEIEKIIRILSKMSKNKVTFPPVTEYIYKKKNP